MLRVTFILFMKGCGRPWVTDGIWKLQFPHCMFRVQVYLFLFKCSVISYVSFICILSLACLISPVVSSVHETSSDHLSCQTKLILVRQILLLHRTGHRTSGPVKFLA